MDIMIPMNRRLFIKGTILSLVFPSHIFMAKESGLFMRSSIPDYFFYDDRFIKAQLLARKISDLDKLTPVQGDITSIWNTELRYQCSHSPFLLKGVTTESFYFCLNRMAGPIGKVGSQVRRIDRDLFFWEIHSFDNLKTG